MKRLFVIRNDKKSFLLHISQKEHQLQQIIKKNISLKFFIKLIISKLKNRIFFLKKNV